MTTETKMNQFIRLFNRRNSLNEISMKMGISIEETKYIFLEAIQN
jgi:hypothetical protein